MPRLNGLPDAGSGLLRQMIPLPGSQSVGPLTLLPVPTQLRAVAPDMAGHETATLAAPAASIVAQAAAVLDEEMARGVLAARGAAGAWPQGMPDASNPVLREMHALVDNLAALWPQLQGGAGSGTTSAQAGTDAQPLTRVGPHTAVRPGERTTIAMQLRNSENRPARLLPAATDLLGSQGGRIPNTQLEFKPAEIALESQAQQELVISASIPADTAPGCYTGLLVLRGQDDLRALITLEVAGTPGRDVSLPQAPPAWSGTPAAAPPSSLMQEAVKLAEDGELGNSDAIRLLQLPHSPQDILQVLARFELQLTREARSKLSLEALAPLPSGVHNQRYEPLFDRHPLSGKTYTTASGTVVAKEIQYYNGEMVQLHGECMNLAPVCAALAGSGHKPLCLQHADGRVHAIAQFWAHQLSDTSLRPYNAAFVIVAAVPDDAPAEQACLGADSNGASSMLAMFDGSFDPARALYQNRTRLFYVRLLDSTRVAIEVGRERMGTDKRPGAIAIARDGQRRVFSVQDGAGNPVATIGFSIADNNQGALADVAAAAATAGLPWHALPAGTEQVYPGVARIGAGPVMHWQWRSDVRPRLQRVEPDSVHFDPRSEEGQMLLRWGFRPQLLGYIPNVRGVVTGVA